ncbi:FAD-binding oxidoreductase [Jatrophihabitans telluris]|uniref:FAD-binding oxidoreductase n=1 Tax=Jatrophihabitans telluris TaxID=2038343 RepID=A0ABY4R0D9_9ACTN|nr:FAD-dependent oxidoreductase [Jatrophihabitans telluris]UQX88620.1 FAD-binding oxidoreductase [Jatrophihabitans telluris]
MPYAASWSASAPIPFWLDTEDRPAPRPTLATDTSADLAVVGGGFSGLWTALLAKEADPDRDVILLEGSRLAWAATGRNGGFCAASLTHGEANGRDRFPNEYSRLDELGRQNLQEIGDTVARYGIDCAFERTGELNVATAPYQVAELRAGDGEFLDTAAVRAEVDSPTYLAGSWNRDTTAMLDPARLAWGLARAAEELGVRIVENTPVQGIRRSSGRPGDALALITGGSDAGSGARTVTARRVALGTNAFTPLLRRIRLHTVPVYDYVLVTEPLSSEQLAAIGWRNRQGIGDSANQFHYYRLTRDNRILWGGYDAVYYFGRRIAARYDERPATFALLAEQFFQTFPQLEGLRFTHRWGGAIDTSTRFCGFFGTGYGGRLAYALGYTGLGVGASRFGANVMLDLLDDRPSERRELELVRTKPLPFPPEPLAYAGIQATRWSLAAADRHEGRRNLWLRALDRAGLGFDS